MMVIRIWLNWFLWALQKVFYYKPRIDKEILEKYHDGLICLSACLAGEVSQAILNNNIEEAKK